VSLNVEGIPEGATILARGSESGTIYSTKEQIKAREDGSLRLPPMSINIDNPQTEDIEGLRDDEALEFYMILEEECEEVLVYPENEIGANERAGYSEIIKYPIELGTLNISPNEEAP